MSFVSLFSLGFLDSFHRFLGLFFYATMECSLYNTFSTLSKRALQVKLTEMSDDLDNFPTSTVEDDDLAIFGTGAATGAEPSADVDGVDDVLTMGFGGNYDATVSADLGASNFGAADFGVESKADEGAGFAFVNSEPEVKQESALAKWEAERAIALQAKADAERAAKAENVAKANEEREAFAKKFEESITRAKATNRAEEKQWRSDFEQTNKSGTDWEKVAKYCDLKPRPDTKTNPAKTERMRKLLVQLKNEPTPK